MWSFEENNEKFLKAERNFAPERINEKSKEKYKKFFRNLLKTEWWELPEIGRGWKNMTKRTETDILLIEERVGYGSSSKARIMIISFEE